MELFIRSTQMQNLFTKQKQSTPPVPVAIVPEPKPIVSPQTTPAKVAPAKTHKYENMKIGEIVRTTLRDILQSGRISNEEIELFQTKTYCKKTFDIQFPLLVKAALTNGISPKRYYAQSLTIKGERYFLCSEWYEVPTNNDRPYLLKWLELHS